LEQPLTEMLATMPRNTACCRCVGIMSMDLWLLQCIMHARLTVRFDLL
jgi:hypothetical protein